MSDAKKAPAEKPAKKASERRSPKPATPVFVKIIADGSEFGPRGKVLALSPGVAAPAIDAGEAVKASDQDRAIAGV